MILKCHYITVLMLICFCSANPVLNPVKTETSPTHISASQLTSYPIIVSDIQASDLFDAHFPVYLTMENNKVKFSRTEWTKSTIFDKLAAALNKESLKKFCVNFLDENSVVEFTKDERSISVLLLRAMKEDNHLFAYQC